MLLDGMLNLAASVEGERAGLGQGRHGEKEGVFVGPFLGMLVHTVVEH